MKNLSDVELFQCKYVSSLFEYSTKKKEGSSKVFVKSYVYSSICKRISNKSFYLESLDITSAYEVIKKEKNLCKGKDIYPSYVMAWIGYIMQYFECTTGIPMISIYKKIKPDELYYLYESYHSLDNDLVVKRIAEAKKINLDLNNSEILRKITIN